MSNKDLVSQEIKRRIKNFFVPEEKCLVCDNLITKGEEISEIRFLSSTEGLEVSYHPYCWERRNEKGLVVQEAAWNVYGKKIKLA